jgi:hypothetical protein
MMKTRTGARLIRSAIALASAIVFVAAGSTGIGARMRSKAAKVSTVQQHTIEQQKPIKLRYYGGPKYPMYPQ